MILHLVRHPPVAKHWQRCCYGQSDPGLSRAGQAMIAVLVDELVALKPDVVLHSDMKRTRALALPLADRLGVVSITAPLWRERDFGDWEGQSWNAIYRKTGNAMDGMIDAPDDFRPGGGETTGELSERIKMAVHALPGTRSVIIITHGGPIACVCAARAGAKLQQLAAFVPPTASIITV